MLYTWTDIYSQQLQSGDNFLKLKPTYSIWLVDGTLMSGNEYAHEFKMQDRSGYQLIKHGSIWVFEINKFNPAHVTTDVERWLEFFKEGATLDDDRLPQWMQNKEMRQAMSTLRQFSEKEKQYHKYQARQNYLRQQQTIEQELIEERKQKEAALQEKEAALKDKERDQLEIGRLKALLAARNKKH